MGPNLFVHRIAERLGVDEERAHAIGAIVLEDLRHRLTDATTTDGGEAAAAKEALLRELMCHGGMADRHGAEDAVVAVFAALRSFDRVTANSRGVSEAFRRLLPDLEPFWGTAGTDARRAAA